MKLQTQINYMVAAVILLYAFIPWTSVDFTGRWKLNKNKSDLGEYGKTMISIKVKTEPNSNRIILTSKSTSFDKKEIRFTETLTFDGRHSSSSVCGVAEKLHRFYNLPNTENPLLSLLPLYISGNAKCRKKSKSAIAFRADMLFWQKIIEKTNLKDVQRSSSIFYLYSELSYF